MNKFNIQVPFPPFNEFVIFMSEIDTVATCLNSEIGECI